MTTDRQLSFTPIFVGGAMRTGTSLLQNVLSSATQANDMTVECQYLTEQLSRYATWSQQNERALSDFFKDKDEFRDYTRNLVIDFLNRTHKNQYKPDFLVLKHPEITPYMPLLARFLPTAKFVVSVRDPRDVVASMLTVAGKQIKQGRTSNMVQAGRDVRKLTNLFLSFYHGLSKIPREAPPRLQYVKYEDVALNTNALLPQLSHYTGLDLRSYDPNAKWKYTRPRDENKVFDTKIRGKALSSSSIGNYKSQLSDAEKVEIEETAEKFMVHFRYKI